MLPRADDAPSDLTASGTLVTQALDVGWKLDTSVRVTPVAIYVAVAYSGDTLTGEPYATSLDSTPDGGYPCA